MEQNLWKRRQEKSLLVAQTSDGGYALGGWLWLRSNGGGTNIAIIKTDNAGNVVWTQTYGAGLGYSMTKTSDGGFEIAGTKLVKADAAGGEQWELSFESNSSSNRTAFWTSL